MSGDQWFTLIKMTIIATAVLVGMWLMFKFYD